MFPATFREVLDAEVLFPFSLRDTLLRAAAAGFYQVCWSEQILEEMRRNLVKTGHTTTDKAARLVAVMKAAFPEALVIGYEPLVAVMRNERKDRHVAAAAQKAGAQLVVTRNLSDFRELPDGIEAQSPDHFLGNLFDLDPDSMVELVEEQAAALKNPPRSFEQLLSGLAKLVPEFVALLREHRRSTGDR